MIATGFVEPLTVAEDIELAVSGVSITDVDIAEDSPAAVVEVSLATSNGATIAMA